jgi:hypothetical protein
VNDRVVDALPKAVRGAARAQPAAEEAPEALFDADVARAFLARVEMSSEFVGLRLADGAIEEEIDEML